MRDAVETPAWEAGFLTRVLRHLQEEASLRQVLKVESFSSYTQKWGHFLPHTATANAEARA